MLVLAALVALAVALPAAPPAVPARVYAIAAIPDEPGAIVLPDAPILQAVVADLDADGSGEVVRMVRGEHDAALAELWRLVEGEWALADEPIEVLPDARRGPFRDPLYAGVPLRMIVHRVGGVRRVLVASQPRFEQLDIGPACCLALSGLVLEEGALSLVDLAPHSDPVDALLALDLDGDGTDELLAARSLPPVGGINFPTEARVYRWADGAFGAPTVTELPIGSGDSPFILGDTDDQPGEEAAFISTLGPPGLYRIRLTADDALVVDDLGSVVSAAIGVPLDDGRGLASVERDEVLVRRWPAGSAPEPVAAAEVSSREAELLGAVEIAGQHRLLVHQPDISTLHVLGLPDLTPPQGRGVTRSTAAGALASLPVAPYVGRLPGGGSDGRETVFYAGRMLPSGGVDARFPAMDAAVSATLLGARPIGLVDDRSWLALLHDPHGRAPGADPRGGRFESPVPRADAWVSIAPFAATLTPELDDAQLDPLLQDAGRIGPRERIVTGRLGFVAQVDAPRGSRILRTDLDPSVVQPPLVVPESGRLAVPIVPPVVVTPNPRYRTSLIVVTPAGHGYVATWDVQVLTHPPPLEVSLSTPFGSTAVEVSGRAAPGVEVRVQGRPVAADADGTFATRVELPPWPTEVTVTATDFAGNTARHVATGVGVYDYRQLPWVPIIATLVAVAGVLLFFRVPRAVSKPRRADDDAVLEELEPD